MKPLLNVISHLVWRVPRVLYAARLASSGAPALLVGSWAGCRVTAPTAMELVLVSGHVRPGLTRYEGPTQDVAFPGLLLG